MQIVGFIVAVIFLALTQQAHSLDHDLPIPSLLAAVASNLRKTLIFGVILIFVSFSYCLLMSQPLSSFAIFIVVAPMCYFIANGSTILLILGSLFVFYVAETIHVFVNKRLVSLFMCICVVCVCVCIILTC